MKRDSHGILLVRIGTKNSLSWFDGKKNMAIVGYLLIHLPQMDWDGGSIPKDKPEEKVK